jgi:hypothetical protein
MLYDELSKLRAMWNHRFSKIASYGKEKFTELFAFHDIERLES